MHDLSIDTKVQAKLNDLVTVSLNHNAAVVEYASLIISAGPARDKREQRKRIDSFKEIHDKANAQHIKIIEELEKVFSDDRD